MFNTLIIGIYPITNRTRQMDKITIVIADNHQLVRQTWSLFLSLNPAFEIVGEAACSEMIVDMVTVRNPAIVLVDLDLNEVKDEAFKSWMSSKNYTRFIGVSSSINPLQAKDLLDEGFHGYVTRYSSKDDLIIAIKEVASGRQYVCSEIKKRIIQNGSFYREKQQKMGLLTKKEMDIVSLVRSGCSSKEIALKLFLSVKTVEVHRHNILKKLNLRNSASLVNYMARL
jgi:DNA-binding NarL/FixJ family response regulator